MVLTGFIISTVLFGSDRNISLFIWSEVFFSGIVVLIFTNFDLISPANFSLMTLFSVTGLSLLILFLNNFKKYLFLAGSIILLLLSWATSEIFPLLNFEFPLAITGRLTGVLIITFLIFAAVYFFRKSKSHQPPEE
ncbi:MAG: hypothetical protein GXX85_05930 [Ignavibacteria bacterium]|nr:hypothetical protein [Ignavibacteria bacterium]